MAEDSGAEKTEDASPRRLEKAREEGDVPRSRELATFAVLMTAGAGLWITGGSLVGRLAIGIVAVAILAGAIWYSKSQRTEELVSGEEAAPPAAPPETAGTAIGCLPAPRDSESKHTSHKNSRRTREEERARPRRLAGPWCCLCTCHPCLHMHTAARMGRLCGEATFSRPSLPEPCNNE